MSALLVVALVSAAVPGQKPAPSVEARLAEELSQTPLPDAIPLQAGVLRLHPKVERVDYRILLQVPLSALAKREHEQNGTYSAECAFFVRVLDFRGQEAARFSRLVSKQGPLKDLEPEAATTTVALALDTQFPPGTYRLEAVGQDQVAGKSAVRTLDFTVPPLEEGVAVSSLVLLQRTEPVALGHLDPSDDLQFHGKRIIPDFSGIVNKHAGGQARFYMVIYPQPGVPYEPQLGIEFSRDGRIAGATQPRLPARNDRGNIAFIIEFSTKQFRPGNYVARAVVRQGDSQAESSVRFRVVGGRE